MQPGSLVEALSEMPQGKRSDQEITGVRRLLSGIVWAETEEWVSLSENELVPSTPYFFYIDGAIPGILRPRDH